MNKVVILLCCFAVLSCNQNKNNKSEIKINPKNGLSQITDSINLIINRTDFRNHIYESKEKLKLVEKEIDLAKANNSLSPNAYIEYAKALLDAGRTQEAIDVFNEILEKMPANKIVNQQTKALHEAIAISYLRLGEQNNCIENHSNESCLFPIKGKGIHTIVTGSENAIKKYEEILSVFPDDLRSRWLLNLAKMTLGEYPHGVPSQYLIPPSVFKSEFSIPVFENISSNLSLDINELAGGVVIDDYNNDYWPDILISSWSMFGKIHFYVNDQAGGFIEKTIEAGLAKMIGGLNLIQADYNNDGYLDFYIMRGAWRGLKSMGQLPNSLVKNNGDGTFSDVTIEAGLYDEAPTQSSVWADFNVDGYLDLFVGNETHVTNEPNPCRLYINNKNGTFTDVAPELGLDLKKYVKGVISGDINNDNLPDLYISAIDGPNKMFLNTKNTSNLGFAFEDVTDQYGVSEPLESFPTWFFDFNNDGYDDIFVSAFDKYSLYQQSREVAADYLNIKSNSDFPRLYINRNGKSFSNQTNSAKLNRILPTMGCNFGDLDNDGWLDFYLGTGAPDYRAVVPNRMFRNNSGKNYQDVTYTGNFGHVQKGHGIAFGDLDMDGDQDIYAVMGGSISGDIAQNSLYENPGFGNQWIKIKLIGSKSNKSAIGAKIKLNVKTKDNKDRFIYKTLNSGGSFGANSLIQEIGLGKIIEIKNISINWPNGINEFIDYGAAKPNQIIEISEDSFEIKELNLGSVKFNKNNGQHKHLHQH